MASLFKTATYKVSLIDVKCLCSSLKWTSSLCSSCFCDSDTKSETYTDFCYYFKVNRECLQNHKTMPINIKKDFACLYVSRFIGRDRVSTSSGLILVTIMPRKCVFYTQFIQCPLDALEIFLLNVTLRLFCTN